MTRLNNLHLIFLIVKKYREQMGKNVSHELLINYIRKKTGVSRETATKYISDLSNGIEIEGKTYKIELYNGGYQIESK